MHRLELCVLNAMKILTMQYVENFKNFEIYQYFVRLPACRKTHYHWEWLQIFHTTKVIASDLQNCCSDEDSSTAPWCFFSSFSIFLFLPKRQKVLMNLWLCHTKQPLVHVTQLVLLILLTDTMFFAILYYIVNFIMRAIISMFFECINKACKNIIN